MSKKNLRTTSVIGLLSSVLAFLGIISCCGFPLIAAFLAWFGIGATQLSFFAAYQGWFTGVAILALVYGFYTIYFKSRKSGSEASCCGTSKDEATRSTSCCEPSTKRNIVAKVMLWIGVIAVGATFLLKDETSESISPEDSCCPTTETVKELPACGSGCGVTTPTKPQTESTESKSETSSCCSK